MVGGGGGGSGSGVPDMGRGLNCPPFNWLASLLGLFLHHLGGEGGCLGGGAGEHMKNN
jgi:hypothetical protein